MLVVVGVADDVFDEVVVLFDLLTLNHDGLKMAMPTMTMRATTNRPPATEDDCGADFFVLLLG